MSYDSDKSFNDFRANHKNIHMFDESCLGPFDGLRAICYIMTILYFANFNQKDLLLRNRWKEVEKASTDKSSWVVVA